VYNKLEIDKVIFIFVFFLCFSLEGTAQEDITINTVEASDSIFIESDSVVQAVLISAESQITQEKIELNLNQSVHSPTKAVLYSIIPGGGQIYNKKYWKLPLVYGSIMGCAYAINWNNKNYSDYTQAYFQVMQEDPMKYEEWKNFVMTPGLTEEQLEQRAKDPTFQNLLRGRKDYFRRYRDLSIFIAVGAYALWMIDAYVDAHLFNFDISPDLSMRIEPAITMRTAYSSSTYGINCSLNF
jgi:hypothetical protein